MPNSDHFNSTTPFTLGDLNSPRYTAAFNEVKKYGAVNSVDRSPDQTAIGNFWAYDRPGTGAPPVLFVENMIEIGNAVGNSPAQNARMFAMASVSLADAVIAAWDTKFEVDLWRPITAIRAADDGNPDTVSDPTWVYLGAPGADPGSTTDNFTPPFPAYTSGHATMGGAIFKTLELFYGTNSFNAADQSIGNDDVTTKYTLHSSEPNSGGGARMYDKFTQVGPIGPEMENSPEGENSMSRIYLGIHWRMDQEDGQALGRAVAEYVNANYFQPVPEPGALVLAGIGGAVVLAVAARRHRARRG
jgi:hypothetical protein